MKHIKLLQHVGALILIAFTYQNCSRLQYNPDSENQSTSALKQCTDPNCEAILEGNGSCTFDGQTVAHGDTVTAWKDSAVNPGGVCKSQERKCDNGHLKGNYQYSSCGVGTPNSCLFNGQTIPHGQAVDAYLTSSVAAGGSCARESRVCLDGTLSGSYQYANCAVGTAASCLVNGQTIASGSGIIAFLNSTIVVGEYCNAEFRLCQNGALSGSYANETCQAVAGPATNNPCSFNGQTISSGSSVVAFQNSTVATGSTCVQENRTCTNGTLSGSYAYGSCTVAAPMSCLFNGITVPSGSSVIAYQTSTVAHGNTCNGELRTCTNGVMSGSFAHGSCTVSAAPSCTFNGQTIPHGGRVFGFQASSVPYGQNCNYEERTCNAGTLSGSFAYANCNVGAAASCLFNGQTIAHGQYVAAFATATVPAGGICNGEMRLCNNGTLQGSYTHASCTVTPVKVVKWVNSSWDDSHATACGRVGMVPHSGFGDLGKCASTESRPGPGSGDGWENIHYSTGITNSHGSIYGQVRGGAKIETWGSTHYCYKIGQKHDYDRTDKVVAYLCQTP